MRESVFFEAKLRRFGLWRAAVGVAGALAIATLTAWALATLAAGPDREPSVIVTVAVLLGAVTVWALVPLVRVEGGVLSCRDSIWSFAPDVGAARSGTLEVAIDLGGFLLLRLDRAGAGPWLPVQRRGLERQWHSLRCAVYAPPRPRVDMASAGEVAGPSPPARSSSE